MPSIQKLRQKLGQPGGPSNQDLRQRIQRAKGGGQQGGGGGGQNKAGKQYFQEQKRFAGPSPIPYSGAYETEMGGLRDEFNQSTLDVAGRRLATEQSYGINDHSNPYSQARMLEQDRENQTRSTLNTMARGGQLYSGAMGQQRTIDRDAYGKAQDALLRNYQSDIGELDREGIETQRRYTQGVTGAEAERLQSALSEPPDPTEFPKRPPEAKKYLKALSQRQRQFAKKGKDNKAAALKTKLSRLRSYG